MTVLNKKDIANLLPHREPMLLIDELRDIKKLTTQELKKLNQKINYLKIKKQN